jgi:histidinol-phosphate aminotransferase
MDIRPYVPGKSIELVQKEFGLTDVIKLASNENPLGPSPKAIEAMKDNAHKMFLYPDGYCTDLRNMLAEDLGIEQNQLIFGNGSDEVIKLLGETFIQPGDEVIVANPSFSEYDFVCFLMGGILKKVPLTNHTHDLEKMAEQITEKTKMIFLCNPNNPTGTIVTKEEVDKFLTKIPDTVVVVFDEAYYEYVEAKAYPQSLEYLYQGKENIIILRTFSKIHGLAGLRIGYGIAAPEMIQLLERTREPFNVNLMAQKAALASLSDKGHIQKSRDVNKKGREFLYKSFEEMGLEYIPTYGNFVMVDLQKSSKKAFIELQKRGVIIRTGDVFGMDTFIRVTIGTAEENERFISTLKDVLVSL